jgi:MerR family transcriptional regulator, heat shock protein HspR
VLDPLSAPGGRLSLAMDDVHAPIYTVGQVSEMLGVQPAFLRRLDAEEVIQPARSGGRHRRYSRQQILDVEHVLSLTGDGLTLTGVRRVLELEAQVKELERQIEELGGAAAGRRTRAT